MITKEQVEKFLEDFSLKVKIFGIRFRDDRGKNQNSLLELDITPRQRLDVIMKLDCYDYSEGPVVDALNNQLAYCLHLLPQSGTPDVLPFKRRELWQTAHQRPMSVSFMK